jgi:hypothetical protein
LDSALKTSSRWVDNREGTGLALTWSSGEQVLMKHPDGAIVPYEMTYEYLTKKGNTLPDIPRVAPAVPNVTGTTQPTPDTKSGTGAPNAF